MFWKGKRVLVTGITGFVGSYLARALLERGAEVYGTYRRRADGMRPKNLVERDILEDVSLIECDITNISSMAQALDESCPDVIFHLAAQSFVHRSFIDPVETFHINVTGTTNLLEAVRFKGAKPKIVFAGTSEEYGLVIATEDQLNRIKKKGIDPFPPVQSIPEVPIKETNPLRPMSPYAVSKMAGDYAMRNYYHSFDIPTVVSRAFNHEGAGRGPMFVTSTIVRQVISLKMNETEEVKLGNVSAFRDWTHIDDVVEGYLILAEKGKPGEVYNQGSSRTNSVLSYLLWTVESAGWKVEKIATINNKKEIENPLEEDTGEMFGIPFLKTKVDKLLLEGAIDFELDDGGILIYTDKNTLTVRFDPQRFRPSEVPILLADTRKAQQLGAKITHTVKDIIKDQMNYYLDKEHRK